MSVSGHLRGEHQLDGEEGRRLPHEQLHLLGPGVGLGHQLSMGEQGQNWLGLGFWIFFVFFFFRWVGGGLCVFWLFFRVEGC